MKYYDELPHKPRKKGLKAKIKDPLHKLATDSTSSGIPRILKSKHWFIKLIWVVCFLTSAVYCAHIIKITIDDFLEYNFITRIEQFNEVPSLFPTVTLCNFNTFQTEKAHEFLRRTIKNASPETATLFLLNELFKLNNTEKQSFSLPFNESLTKCRFNGAPCHAHDFEWMFYSFLGNCFSFNSHKENLKNISRAGHINGLHLELFVGNTDTIPAFYRNTGYFIMINNHTIKPMINDLIEVSTGTETSIQVNRLITQKLPSPYNGCMNNLNRIDAFDSDLFRAINKSNRAYRQKNCFDLCYQQEVIRTCNCFLSSLERLNGTNSCSSIREFECSSNLWRVFVASDVNAACSKYCPLECDSMRYRITTSFSSYPNRLYAEAFFGNNSVIAVKYFNGSFSYEQIKKSVVSVNVFYDELSYTLFSQQPKMQLFDLVSNIGGLLGLFLGASFLTLAEIIEAFLEISNILLSSFRNKNSKKKSNKYITSF